MVYVTFSRDCSLLPPPYPLPHSPHSPLTPTSPPKPPKLPSSQKASEANPPRPEAFEPTPLPHPSPLFLFPPLPTLPTQPHPARPRPTAPTPNRLPPAHPPPPAQRGKRGIWSRSRVYSSSNSTAWRFICVPVCAERRVIHLEKVICHAGESRARMMRKMGRDGKGIFSTAFGFCLGYGEGGKVVIELKWVRVMITPKKSFPMK